MNVKVSLCTGSTVMCNSFVIVAENGDAAVVDPGSFDRRFMEALEKEGVKELKYILLTHGHFDHILGVPELKKRFGGKIVIHRLDAHCLESSEASLGNMFGFITPSFSADVTVENRSVLPFGDGEIKVMHTPGHTVGSVCYCIGDHLFTGDTLFCMNVGRMDFPGGNEADMTASVRKLKNLEGFYNVYPGHKEITDLDFERKHNPYMKGI